MTPELERLRQQTAQIMGLLNQVVRQNTTEASRLREEGGPPAERLQQMRGLAEELQANMQRSATGRTEGQGPTSDPLVIWTPPDDDLDAFRFWDDAEAEEAAEAETWPGRYAIDIAPDDLHKANISGSDPYQVLFPNPAIDARIEGLPAFAGLVPYLR